MIKKLLQKDMNRAYLSKICNSKTFLCCFPQLVKFFCVIWYPLWISIVSVHFWFNKTVCVKAKFTFGLKFISIFLQMAPKRKGKRSNELSSENNEEKKTKLKGKHLFWFAVVACVSCVLFAVTPKSSANVGE